MPKKSIALSFDIEDWFTVRNMRELINENDWDKQEYRVNVGVDFILETLSKKDIKATFFILGWVAERSPEMVRKISDLGHEIASHGYSHTPIDLMTPETFESDLVRSIQVLEGITGKKIEGFRAPSFSITKKTAWALDILKKHQIRYDSSVFVTLHPDYGINDFPVDMTKLENGLTEVPMKKSQLLGTKIPVCGGGYFRMLPYSMVRDALRRDTSTSPTVMYFHPWEFDPAQPKVGLTGLKKFRHYVGLQKNRKKFERLLEDFEFTTIKDLVDTQHVFASYEFEKQKVSLIPSKLGLQNA